MRLIVVFEDTPPMAAVRCNWSRPTRTTSPSAGPIGCWY